MACRLFSPEPLPKPMLVYCQLDSWEQFSVKLESGFYHFHSRKCIWNCRLLKWRPLMDNSYRCPVASCHHVYSRHAVYTQFRNYLNFHEDWFRCPRPSVTTNNGNSSPLDKMAAISQKIFFIYSVNEDFCIFITISLKLVHIGPIHNNTTLV